MEQSSKKRCRHCRKLFTPDPRNRKKQKYCSKPECRQASKAASQRKWLRKNPDYFCGETHVERVRKWRCDNPGYRRTKTKSALQDHSTAKSVENQPLNSSSLAFLLQDLLPEQLPVFIGIISHITGIVLQEELAPICSHMVELGKDILSSGQFNHGGHNDRKASHSPGQVTQDPKTIQLGRSSPGTTSLH
jgi:hypothetical protein